MKNYLVELTFFVFGLYLLSQSQYITLLILLFLSLILVSKGIQHKSSLLIPLIIILFITEYHKYFPYRNEIKNKENNDNYNDNYNDLDDNDLYDNQLDAIEGFKSNKEDKQINKIKKTVRKRMKTRKNNKKRLEKEMQKSNAGLPKRYIDNQIKIKSKSKNLSEAWDKWTLLKENLYILLNTD
jgi:hypothetical protein